MSMSFYDTNRRVWRMVWNDDANQSNDFEGAYTDGAMRFKGWVLDRSGKRLARIERATGGVARHHSPYLFHVRRRRQDVGR